MNTVEDPEILVAGGARLAFIRHALAEEVQGGGDAARVQDANDLDGVGERLTGDEAFREVLRQSAVADVVENARLVREVQERVAKH